jgi:hypothetical protein
MNNQFFTNISIDYQQIYIKQSHVKSLEFDQIAGHLNSEADKLNNKGVGQLNLI